MSITHFGLIYYIVLYAEKVIPDIRLNWDFKALILQSETFMQLKGHTDAENCNIYCGDSVYHVM